MLFRRSLLEALENETVNLGRMVELALIIQGHIASERDLWRHNLDGFEFGKVLRTAKTIPLVRESALLAGNQRFFIFLQ